MRQLQAQIVLKTQHPPDWWQLVLHSEAWPTGMAVGQYVLVACDNSYLRRAIFPTRVPDSPQVRAVWLRPTADAGLNWLLSRQVGDQLELLGPLGRGFPEPGGAKHLLLVGDADQVWLLLDYLHRARHTHRSLTVALSAPNQRRLIPTSYLPTEVEIYLATKDGSTGHRGSVVDLLSDAMRWAEQVYAFGSPSLYQELQRTVNDVRALQPEGFAYGLFSARLLPCGVGLCDSCLIQTRFGWRTLCQDGPVFDLMRLVYS